MSAHTEHAPPGYRRGLRLRIERVMDDDIIAAEVAQKARLRALIVPREHGAWGLLFVPLFTGLAVGLAPAYHVGWLLLFTAAAFFLFWLRTPVESLIGSGVISAHTSLERRTAAIASGLLGVAAVACLADLLWGGRNGQLVYIGVIAGVALALQTALRRMGRDFRMASQLTGAVALTATAPAAYYLGTGRLGGAALTLWIANWLFAWNQIHFVQLRIHAAKAARFAEKFASGRYFFAGQLLLLAALVAGVLGRLTSPLSILAFVPTLFRGTRWFFSAPQPLNVRKLGWSEMRQGIAFGVLLAVALLLG